MNINIYIYIDMYTYIAHFFVKDCSSSSECESVQCFENHFDADGTALNGCEASCAQLPQACFSMVFFI